MKKVETYEDWLETRPPEVAALLRRWSPGQAVTVHGETAYGVGASEVLDGPPVLMLSHINPHVHYQAAIDDVFRVHEECLLGDQHDCQ